MLNDLQGNAETNCGTQSGPLDGINMFTCGGIVGCSGSMTFRLTDFTPYFPDGVFDSAIPIPNTLDLLQFD